MLLWYLYDGKTYKIYKAYSTDIRGPKNTGEGVIPSLVWSLSDTSIVKHSFLIKQRGHGLLQSGFEGEEGVKVSFGTPPMRPSKQIYIKKMNVYKETALQNFVFQWLNHSWNVKKNIKLYTRVTEF